MNELALFNDLFNGFDDDAYLPSFSFKKAFHTPKVDVKETKDNYSLEMDLPGKSEKDVNVELNGNVLTISSGRESRKDEGRNEKDGPKWLIRERSCSKFSRSFKLPDDVDSESLSANVRNGVLTVTMPRKAPAESKKIAITAS